VPPRKATRAAAILAAAILADAIRRLDPSDGDDRGAR
jgi:hypothetical protein